MKNDQIALSDIVSYLRQGWRWMVAGALIGLVVTAGWLLIPKPNQFEAIAIIEPATVGLSANSMKGAEVESAAKTLERLKLASFYTDELRTECDATTGQRLAEFVKASLVENNSLIKLTYRAPSVTVAHACIDAIIAKLAKSQAEASEPIIKMLQEELLFVQKRFDKAESDYERYEKSTSTVGEKSLVKLRSFSTKYNSANLQNTIFDLKVKLSAQLTRPLQLLEPIITIDVAHTQNSIALLIRGIFGGLLLGTLSFLVWRSLFAR